MPQGNFDGSKFVNKADGFNAPSQLPAASEVADEWQRANKSWWERTPMRYDWREEIQAEEGSREYYEQLDQRFLGAVRQYLPWNERPFEQFVPYARLREMDVLEIGVGQGTHAQLIAPMCKSFTGIDLTQKASEATRRRLALFDIPARIEQMDAEHMTFATASFDFIWSWGVIHHSSNTQQVLREMARVLRPGGEACVMVYFRSPLQYYLFNGLGRGLFKREFWTVGNVHRINQAATDGALARFFSKEEFEKVAEDLFECRELIVTGQKADALPLPHGAVKDSLLRHAPDGMTRFMTDTLRMGTFLVAKLRRLP